MTEAFEMQVYYYRVLKHQLQQFLQNLEELYALGQHHVPLHGQLYSAELDFEQLKRLSTSSTEYNMHTPFGFT
jgi:hypothetical protein